GSFDPELALNKDGALDYKGVRAQQANPNKAPYPLYVVKTTFDDDATQYCVRFLIEHVAATQRLNDPKDNLARQTLNRALSGMIRAQYPNGAWPERYDGSPRNLADYPVKAAEFTDDWPRQWPADRQDDYMNYYTLNDRVMRDCISTMLLASKKLGREDCLASAKRGGDFLILSQFPEPQPGWAQQYDSNMCPGWGRAWEVPGITSQESRTVLEGLLELYLVTGEEKYLKPINPAIAWLERSRIAPDTWSRYYEVGSNQPIYGTEDGRITNVIERAGYTWESSFRIPEFIEKYNYIMTVGRDAWNADPRMNAATDHSANEARIDRVIAELDAKGRWLTKGALARKQPVLDKMISAKEFSKNMSYLCDWMRKEKEHEND
ncbi:MAG: pectate lyase, partial [Verrucomicrobiota bacterium]|nr:pectate lyase [Verrucomicrobiota bacterium]